MFVFRVIVHPFFVTLLVKVVALKIDTVAVPELLREMMLAFGVETQ